MSGEGEMEGGIPGTLVGEVGEHCGDGGGGAGVGVRGVCIGGPFSVGRPRCEELRQGGEALCWRALELGRERGIAGDIRSSDAPLTG